ncbi:PAS domain S-box protein [Ktedonosporobacter rubrisoli]|uniref:histidine kinase n=1 Tax=Ktedonosporobacter rubrisoli TaxID=2509675 RepID=A0A4P6JKZ4_KTERU|nr:PAS domain S-box protein [Ktedonosporobacter rubrisoli]QBD75858.1 PAS domain S-box protein [Ktedonosporobacter rubrisoli]
MAIISNRAQINLHDEEIAKQRGQLAHSTVGSKPDLSMLLNAEGLVTYTSPSIASLLDFMPEEIIGSSLSALVNPADLEGLQSLLTDIEHAPGKYLSTELRLRTRNGSWRWFEANITNLLAVPGVEAIVSSFHDITEQKQTIPVWHQIKEARHFVQFYTHDDFMLDSLSKFIGTGLKAGQPCIVIATSPHLASLAKRLHAQGIDLTSAFKDNSYIAMDASQVLTQFMLNGTPDTQRFLTTIERILARANRSEQGLRIFGEMVELLWVEGKQNAAIRLEQLWNDLHDKEQNFSLFCAYSIRNFSNKAVSEKFDEICQQHSHVLPDESYSLLTDPDERLRAITHLQQKANSLEYEITERQSAEERLRISENRYRRLFEASTDGILIVDPLTCTIADANPCLAELLKYTREQLIGKKIWHMGLFPDRENALKIIHELRAKQFIHYDTLPLQTKDGQRRYVEFVSNLYQANGHEVIQCNMRDITDRKLAEEALRESEARLRFIAESMPQKIFTARLDGSIEYLNPQWVSFTGLSYPELLGWGWTRAIHPDDIEEHLKRWQHSMESKESFYCEQRFRRADGIYLWHITRAVPLRVTETNTTMWIGASTDIEEQKQLEERKNAFISMASHELKTPVTSLQGFTQVLQRRLKQQQGDNQTLLFLNRMDTQIQKLKSLIGDLLDMSKIQAGVLSFRETLFDFDALVLETVENVQATCKHQLSIQGKALTRIYGDRDRLEQVLINLLTNATKYSPQADSVIVHVAKNQQQVEVAVKDFGIGIAEEYHERIFERFYQVSDLQGKTYPGLGIGLYITRTIIERHGGHLWLESHKGKGSTFHFTLPIHNHQQNISSFPFLESKNL